MISLLEIDIFSSKCHLGPKSDFDHMSRKWSLFGIYVIFILQPLSNIKAMDINVKRRSFTTETAQKYLLGSKLSSFVGVSIVIEL